MRDGLDERMEVRHSQENPCAGTYTLMVPEDRDAAWPLHNVKATGIAMAPGTYRVRFERVGDS